jgi:small subunit ribosomal protein S20
MPIIKSAIKRARTSAKRRSHNLKVKAAVKKDIRQVVDAVSANDAKAATEAIKAAVSEIDRAVKKGVLHKNTAARRKSRLMTQINKTFKEEPKKTAAKKPAAKKTEAKPAAKKTTKKTA